MSTSPIFVVSDIHLGVIADVEPRFRRFLAHVGAAGAQHLVINGDLFDFWFEYRTVIPREHFRVLAALADLREGGVRLSFVGGNHDAWVGDFLRNDVGMDLLPDFATLRLHQKKALLVHGDGIGPGDLKYKLLKKVIRSGVSTAGFRFLHPDLGARIAGLASTTHEKTGNAGGASVQRAESLAAWARDRLEADPTLDMIFAGHTHTPAVTEYFPGRFYINTGDWINHFTYLELLADGRPSLKTWS